MLDGQGTSTREGYSQWSVIAVDTFVTCLITSNVMAVKLTDILGLILPAGVSVFPVRYIVGDVITEVYGFHSARRVIWLGFFCNVSVVFGGCFAKLLRHPPLTSLLTARRLVSRPDRRETA